MEVKMRVEDTQECLQMERNITDVMLELGIPAHLNGFRYLRTSVTMCLTDMEVVSSVTKLLYPDVAKRHKTTEQKIERAIRNAIEVSWERGKAGLQEELFGYSYRNSIIRPTNSEYVARIADYVILGKREKDT